MNKTILVIGGAGYIGSHTSLYLLQQNYDVVILDKFIHDQYFPKNLGKLIVGDFADTKILDSIFSQYKIDAVMHFAANIEVAESVKNPSKFYNNNVSNVIALLGKMMQYHVNNFIFSSSCAVYGVPNEVPISENCELNPISPYGKTKFFIESILKDYDKAYNLKSVSLRYFNACGALPEYGLGEQHKPETHLIPLLLKAMQENSPFKLFGNKYPTKDGTCVRDYLHVWDIASAHCLALHYLMQNGISDVFNLGSEKGFSVKEIVDKVQTLFKKEIKVFIEKEREGDPHTLLANASKIKDILNWKPNFSSLDLILQSAYNFEYGFRKKDQEFRKSILNQFLA